MIKILFSSDFITIFTVLMLLDRHEPVEIRRPDLLQYFVVGDVFHQQKSHDLLLADGGHVPALSLGRYPIARLLRAGASQAPEAFALGSLVARPSPSRCSHRDRGRLNFFYFTALPNERA